MNQIATMNYVQTMTSREIAELTGKRHDHVVRDIEKMADDISPNLGASPNGVKTTTYYDAYNRQQKQYELDKEMTMTLVTGYSIPLRHAVIKRWQELERVNESKNPMAVLPSVKADAAFLECMASLLRMSPTAVNQGARYIAQKHGMDSHLIPDYVDDGQQAHHSATELLKSHNAGVNAAAFNKLLEAKGFVCQMERKSSSASARGGIKKYWAITDKGLDYGKNLAHKSSGGRETQPFWRDDKFAELMKAVGVEPRS